MPRSNKPRSKRPRSGKGLKVSKPIKAAIKSAISRNLETKENQTFGLNTTILTVANTTPKNLCLLPEPSQGTGESDRIGNVIDVKKLVVSGIVNLLPYNSADATPVSPGPFWVKMWVVSAKNVNTNTFSNTDAATNFFTSNNASAGFQATVRDMILDVNTDLFTVHRYKMFKLGAASTSSVVNPASYYDNSPMAVPFRFDLSKHVGKLKFDESQTWATNKNLFLVISTCRCDGSTGSATIPQCEYHYKVITHYKDA